MRRQGELADRYDCECTKNQAGCDKYEELEDANCICTAGTPCESACAASYCAGMDSDAACDACWDALTGDEPCYATTDTACDADAACKAFLDASSASCDALP